MFNRLGVHTHSTADAFYYNQTLDRRKGVILSGGGETRMSWQNKEHFSNADVRWMYTAIFSIFEMPCQTNE